MDTTNQAYRAELENVIRYWFLEKSWDIVREITPDNRDELWPKIEEFNKFKQRYETEIRAVIHRD